MANDLVLVSSRADARGSKPESVDALAIELEAMATIGRAFEAIEDVTLRQRVLQWAVERWGVDRPGSTVIVEPRSRTGAGPLASDPALSVDSIDDLFDDDAAPAQPEPAPKTQTAATPGKTPVESMLQSLAADFQRLADDWNGA